MEKIIFDKQNFNYIEILLINFLKQLIFLKVFKIIFSIVSIEINNFFVFTFDRFIYVNGKFIKIFMMGLFLINKYKLYLGKLT